MFCILIKTVNTFQIFITVQTKQHWNLTKIKGTVYEQKASVHFCTYLWHNQ